MREGEKVKREVGGKKGKNRYWLWILIAFVVALGNGIVKGCQKMLLEYENEEREEEERRQRIAERKREKAGKKKGRRRT